jgi:hypothetical protein
MSIKPSRTADVRALIDALASTDEVRRESAIARLAVIGRRAVDRLAAAYSTAVRDQRVAILRALEAIADPRVAGLASTALGEGGDVAVAGASALRPLLDSTDSRAATSALDALLKTALDPAAERRVRMAAFDALRDMPASVRDPVASALEHRADGKGLAGGPTVGDAADAAWQDALEGRLPDDPAMLREALHARAPTAPLGALQRMIEGAGARERASDTPERRDAWLAVRGALHQAVALRGSRVAIYDLRETLTGAGGPLPPAFLAAAHAAGDGTCLEAIAAAWTAATRQQARPRFNTAQHGSMTEGDDVAARWRHQLEEAFRAIVKREKISKRSAVLKRIETRYPQAAMALSTPSRTTPRRQPRGRT